ncbi:type VI secretion system lipoprotein TssJ [Marinibactrum halimedae]|uniref:type VI secretion system lipoprotein TssJ n=1 Tax=Marinibactrum halimedae TaxID=1444977 RepID=UPI001E4F7F84|nr:type VI secretion system lipoprotein TssJ [Marinibactrum halimedae]MCD9458353.1 type VI secretion system lipoprotein TssJ [Marinibactrum halimedae]
MNKSFNIAIIAILFSVILIGCQTTREVLNFDTSAEINFTAHPDVNPDKDGRPSPVILKLFTLTDDRQFAREEFLNLYEDANGRLGNDLIDTITLREFSPGEERQEVIELTPEVKFIGVMAEYINYEDARSLLLLPILEHNENEFDVDIAHLSVKVSKE